ncbi:hypothetical protein [Lewinella sp. W8]|uniref:hypothetical protein n=1 Tax=Lewinella sp. W8 TaxID=2528208 RepID=UPI0010672394|nr:hypothetical protein [Lewinella sp. W8]MTB53018.1 hypothetical protein [Lewinella sp. W8]
MDNVKPNEFSPLREAKPLPEGDTFTANGNTYRWIPVDKIGISRWSIIANLLDLLYSGFDSFESIRQYMVETQKEIMPMPDPEVKLYVFRRLQTYLDNIVRKSQDRYHLSLHICTLICLKEGDDIRDYDQDRANAYISDWAAEGYSHVSFFAIAGGLSEEFATDFRQTQKRLLEEEKTLRAATAGK